MISHAKVLLYWQICNFFAKNTLFFLKNLLNSKKCSTFVPDFGNCACRRPYLGSLAVVLRRQTSSKRIPIMVPSSIG